MKNAIRYYYHIEVNNIEFLEYRYYFDSYVLIEVEKPVDFNIYHFLVDNHYPVYNIVQNKDGEYVTNIDGKAYLLLYVISQNRLSCQEIENFQIPVYEEETLPWHELWMNKVDFYEKHVQTINSNKIKDSFFYYIGMAENAIEFYQMIKKDYPLYISHGRMSKDFDFWNPTNFTVDYKVRDIAGYTKRLFFEGNLHLPDLFLYFYRAQFLEQDYLLFYARMLYPSYYFDCYDNIVKGENEDCLDLYLEKVDDYENLLKELYFYFSRFLFLPKIDWIVDK